MNSHDEPKRVWFDVNIGSDPSIALGLLFALKHPEILVVGVSVSGGKQEQRLEEAYRVLEYAGEYNISVHYGEDVSREAIDAAQPEHTIVRGPLTNIARLVLDETSLGTIHFVGGAFRAVYCRGETIYVEQKATLDKDATRIVLSQYDDVVINSFEATSTLLIPQHMLEELGKAHPFLKSRFDGFQEHLVQKNGEGFDSIIAADSLAVCDVLDMPTITREVIEFKIQSNGTFFATAPLDSNPEPIEEETSNPESIPTPTVKHQVIRTVNSWRILKELTSTL